MSEINGGIAVIAAARAILVAVVDAISALVAFSVIVPVLVRNDGRYIASVTLTVTVLVEVNEAFSASVANAVLIRIGMLVGGNLSAVVTVSVAVVVFMGQTDAAICALSVIPLVMTEADLPKIMDHLHYHYSELFFQKVYYLPFT